MKVILAILFVCILTNSQIIAQSHRQIEKKSIIPKVETKKLEDPEILNLFKKIEAGIRESSTKDFENDFSEIVYIAISSDEKGNYSSNQANSILANFFSNSRCISFEFTKIYSYPQMPYATGRYDFIQKGLQKFYQIYVSLSYENNRWVISQFNIY